MTSQGGEVGLASGSQIEDLLPNLIKVKAAGAEFVISDCDGDRAIVRETFQMNVYRYHPRPRDLVVDVGAHKGIFATWCALHGAHVLAFEPCVDSYQALLRNVYMNRLEDRVSPRNLAIWSQACRLPLYHWPGDAGGNSLTENTRVEAEEVFCTTLEEVFHSIGWCDFLKVDCEGSEFEIVGNAPQEVLKRVGALSIEVHSPALDPGGREHPVKFTAYTPERYAKIIDNLQVAGFRIEELRARNGDPNYIYATR
jgi:FkbM family methyltransferase